MHKKYRRGRAAALNMVITETEQVLQSLKHYPLEGKLTSNAIRVPVPNGSVILNLEVSEKTSSSNKCHYEKYALKAS
jgi:glyceraldehyde 3-phosphate dehydrogenase